MAWSPLRPKGLRSGNYTVFVNTPSTLLYKHSFCLCPSNTGHGSLHIFIQQCRGMERTYEAPSNEAPHMLLGYYQGRLVTYLQPVHFFDIAPRLSSNLAIRFPISEGTFGFAVFWELCLVYARLHHYLPTWIQPRQGLPGRNCQIF